MLKASGDGRLERIESECKRIVLNAVFFSSKVQQRVGDWMIPEPKPSYSPAPALGPPDADAAAQAAHERQVVRQHHEAERHHPESENGQKSENATDDQAAANADPGHARLRQPHPPGADREFAGLGVNAIFMGPFGLVQNAFLSLRPSFFCPQEMGVW